MMNRGMNCWLHLKRTIHQQKTGVLPLHHSECRWRTPDFLKTRLTALCCCMSYIPALQPRPGLRSSPNTANQR
jgi:hypothetical protein